MGGMTKYSYNAFFFFFFNGFHSIWRSNICCSYCRLHVKPRMWQHSTNGGLLTVSSQTLEGGGALCLPSDQTNFTESLTTNCVLFVCSSYKWDLVLYLWDKAALLAPSSYTNVTTSMTRVSPWLSHQVYKEFPNGSGVKTWAQVEGEGFRIGRRQLVSSFLEWVWRQCSETNWIRSRLEAAFEETLKIWPVTLSQWKRCNESFCFDSVLVSVQHWASPSSVTSFLGPKPNPTLCFMWSG